MSAEKGSRERERKEDSTLLVLFVVVVAAVATPPFSAAKLQLAAAGPRGSGSTGVGGLKRRQLNLTLLLLR